MREHNDAMRTIGQSLKLNGVFVIDYLNVFVAEEQPESAKREKK